MGAVGRRLGGQIDSPSADFPAENGRLHRRSTICDLELSVATSAGRESCVNLGKPPWIDFYGAQIAVVVTMGG